MARLISVALPLLSLFTLASDIRGQSSSDSSVPPPNSTSTTTVLSTETSAVSQAPAATSPAPENKHGLVPSRQDIEMKERLESLSHLSDDQLTAELHKWPRYQQMSIGERGRFLQSIQELRDHRKSVAMARAKELNLNLNPEQQAEFEKSFWDKKLKAERELWQEIEPRRKLLDEQVNQQLLKEFAGEIKKTNK